MFASNTHLAAKLICTTDLEAQLLLTEDISPALQTFLADPTKPPKAPIPSHLGPLRVPPTDQLIFSVTCLQLKETPYPQYGSAP